MLIGLSTHSPAQIDAVDASVVDYIGVGPIHADAHQARPAGRGPRADPLRGRPCAGAVLRDRRPRRGQPRRGARRRRRSACACCARSPPPRTPSGRRAQLRERLDARRSEAELDGRRRPSAASDRADRERARRAGPRGARAARRRTSARRRCSSRSACARCSRSAVLVGGLTHPRPRQPRRLAAGRDLPRGDPRGAGARHVPPPLPRRCSASRRCSPFRSSSPRSRWSSPRRSLAAGVLPARDRARRAGCSGSWCG